jgi:choline dehydrogenase-like flavoprotein
MNPTLDTKQLAMTWDLVVVGTGFASSFFLYEALKSGSSKILVLERGARLDHAAQIAAERRRRAQGGEDPPLVRHAGLSGKTWTVPMSFGGGSNCWWAATPRMLPSDFQIHSLYGVGVDWPVTYDDLVDEYAEAERVMGVSGPSDYALFPDPIRYPLPPHRFSDVDRAFKAAYPQLFYEQPTARASVPYGNRPQCCGNGVCNLCPIDAKFTIENGLGHVYDDARVTLVTGWDARALRLEGDRATAVLAVDSTGREHEIRCNAVALGAGGVFNPVILMRSGMQHPALGTGLCEQGSLTAVVDFRGLEGLGGSTSITGHGFMLYDGGHRKRHAAALIEVDNLPTILRPEAGRERQFARLKLIFEDLPQSGNRVELGSGDLPILRFGARSSYLQAGVASARTALPRLLSKLPVEAIHYEHDLNPTEHHILSTTVMGDDAKTSIVDRNLVSHTHRNVFVLGGSVFPTCAPANPTLTLSALSLRAARLAGLG